MKMKMSNLETRIVRLLQEWYPITVEELRDELSVRQDSLVRALKSLAVKGVIALEPLTDKTYVRLLVPGIEVGTSGRARRRGADYGGGGSEDDDSIAYR
jgi:DNA-binding MarR family transcriptional regulator